MTIHKVCDSQKLQDACNKAAAGDTILIFGGNYTQKSVMRGKSGRPDAPIRFIGGDSVVIDAGRLPEHIEWHAEKNGAKTGPPPHPKPKDFSFLQLFDCHHVVIENLRVANCWPSIFYFEQSAHLVVRGCALLDATYAIYCTGPATSHVLIENNMWQQDSSPGHLLWTTIEWTSAHGGAGGDDKHRYFNGGFVSGKNIAGAFVIRGNQISDAYNGIRLLCDPDMETDGDGIPRNAGIHIHDNDFIRIRDNPTEPEEFAHDWHVRHNRLLDCYAWFSFDGAGGGYWYFYGNTADFTSRPGLLGPGGGTPNSDHTMGRVLKLSYENSKDAAEGKPRVPEHPWFVFNNSWRLRCPIIHGEDGHGIDGQGPDRTDKLRFANNAFEWCAGDDGWLCAPVAPVANFVPAAGQANVFDFNLWHRGSWLDYGKAIRQSGNHEQNGIAATAPVFAAGGFDLAIASPGFGTADVFAIAAPAGTVAIRQGSAGGLDRGAMQSYGLVSVPDLEAKAETIVAAIIGLHPPGDLPVA